MSLLNRGCTPLLVATLCAACGGGTSAPGDGGPDDGALGFTAVDVETTAPERVEAGTLLAIGCLLLDAAGEAHTAPPGTTETIRAEPALAVERTADGMSPGVVAVGAGTLEVACTFPSLGLADTTPAFVEVVAGPPAHVTTTLDFDSIAAGEATTATCEASDAWGNPVPADDATLRADPPADENVIEDRRGTFERAGEYEMLCELPGAESHGARLEVVPGLPAALVISLVPDLPVYVVGQVVELARAVTDRFGNPTEGAIVPVTSRPSADARQVGDGRFRFASDGLYTLTATVTPPTEGGVRLSESVDVLVDSQGPAIDCRSPADGGIVDATPGVAIPFVGAVSDLTGVTSVSVDGTNIPLDAAGAFVAPVTTRFGVNFVDVAAVDSSGQETSRTCAFLVADRWAPDDRSFADSLSLRLRGNAFDDMERSDLDSLNDILSAVLSSPQLEADVHAALVASNPLKPSSCDQSVFGVCVLRSEVIYLNSELRGARTAALTLVPNGVRADLVVREVRVRIRVRGHVAGINYDTTGWVTVAHADASVIFDPRISGGQPRISVRAGSASASVGRIDTSFSGLDGAVIDVVVSLFNSSIRSLLAGLVRDYLTSNLGSILDDLVRSLDIASLATTFDVPRLDGGTDVPVTFTPRFSSVDTTSSRMLFGLGTQLRAPAAHARPTRGAPIPSGAVLFDPSGPSSVALAVHVGFIGQALHALWRGGYFDVMLDRSSVSGLPAGASVRLSTALPPAAELTSGGRVQVSMGAVWMRLVYPSLLSGPLDAMVGMRASMRVRVVGDQLEFDDFRLDELHFSPFTVSIDAMSRMAIEDLLQRVLQTVVEGALGDAIPAIPIPSFELPASLSTYGLPGGASMGLTSPAASTTPRHLVLDGGFGVL